MSINQCIDQLLSVEAARKGGVCGPAAMAVGLARVGSATQAIVAGPLNALRHVDFGPPLHSLVLVGDVDHVEAAMLDVFKITDATPRRPHSPTDAATSAPE